jgi:hypothetical protein
MPSEFSQALASRYGGQQHPEKHKYRRKEAAKAIRAGDPEYDEIARQQQARGKPV